MVVGSGNESHDCTYITRSRGVMDVVSAYTHPSAPSDHFERGAMVTGDRVRKSLRFP